MCRPQFIRAILFVGVAALAGNSAFAAGAKYAGGSGDSVKGFGSRPFDELKGVQTPKIVYFYDADVYHNNFAEKIEGKNYLANEDVQAALKKFAKLKVKYDGTAPKGWPEVMRASSKNSAAILLMSSDNVTQIWFDQHTSPDIMTAEGIMNAVKAIEEYDKAHKPDAEKDKDKDKVAAKGKDDAPANNDALKIKGLPTPLGDDNNKDKKTPPAPPADTGKKPTSGPKDE